MIWKIIFAAIFLIGVSADDENWRDLARNCFEGQTLFFRSPVPLQYFYCIEKVFHIENRVEEILEEAITNGTTDELSKNFCAKSGALKTCISNTTTELVPCMNKGLANQINAPYKELVDFVCYNEGERMALFLNESGGECFKEKINSIFECMGVRATNTDLLEFMVLSIAAQCTRFDVIAPCVVKELKECPSPVPGNISDALFENIRQHIVCQKQKN